MTKHVQLTEAINFWTVETMAGSRKRRGGHYVTLPAGTIVIMPLPHLLNEHTGAQVKASKNTIPLESIVYPGQFIEL